MQAVKLAVGLLQKCVKASQLAAERQLHAAVRLLLTVQAQLSSCSAPEADLAPAYAAPLTCPRHWWSNRFRCRGRASSLQEVIASTRHPVLLILPDTIQAHADMQTLAGLCTPCTQSHRMHCTPERCSWTE